MSLKISPISKCYKDQVILDRLELPKIKEGSLVSIIGKNGAGKSTFLKETIRLVNQQQPVVEISGQTLTFKDFGYLPQDYKIHAVITVIELLIMTINIDNKSLSSKENSLELGMRTLDKIDIAHLANKNCFELSGGESQLVGLAQAIVNQPKLLILDEPTSALDLKNQMLLMNYVRNYIKEHKIYGLMVIHDINLAMQFSSYLAVFKNGSLYKFGSTEIINESLIKSVFEVKSEIIMTDSYPVLTIQGV